MGDPISKINKMYARRQQTAFDKAISKMISSCFMWPDRTARNCSDVECGRMFERLYESMLAYENKVPMPTLLRDLIF